MENKHSSGEKQTFRPSSLKKKTRMRAKDFGTPLVLHRYTLENYRFLTDRGTGAGQISLKTLPIFTAGERRVQTSHPGGRLLEARCAVKWRARLRHGEEGEEEERENHRSAISV